VALILAAGPGQDGQLGVSSTAWPPVVVGLVSVVVVVAAAMIWPLSLIATALSWCRSRPG
jgi:hypothetical protein